MAPPPAPSERTTTELLAVWLAAHMERTRQTAADIARELGVDTETVRLWLNAAGRHAAEANAFAHLDTPVKLGTWLRGRIADSGSSVRRIAETTDSVSIGTVYNWLKGEHLPPPPVGEEPDRFDLLLSNPALGLSLRQRVQLDEVRRRLTGTSLQAAAISDVDWPARALPAGNRTFTGRGDELKRLDRLLLHHARSRAVVISALTGMGGAGKTELAVHWARSRPVRATFTDGCLYINLNGYAETPPLTVDVALRKLLQQLGVDPKRMPPDTDALSAFFQETLTGRRLLLVLDNAHAEPQVRPLLPSEPECLAVVTSRNRLQGLDVTDGPVTHLRLDVLAAREAASLLRNLLGGLASKSASDDDLNALGEACGYLPLALQIAAANYLTHAHPRGVTIREYADSLHGRRLDALAVGPADPDTAVAAALDHSYRHLSHDARRAYRLLGLHPGPDWSCAAATSLTAETADRTRSLLSDLVQANLLTEPRPGRYTLHDLVREHATYLARTADSDESRRQAVCRLLDHYLHTAHGAALLLDPHRDSIALGLPQPEVASEVFDDHEQAAAWFAAEHAVLVAATEYAYTTGRDTHAWQLAWSVTQFLGRLGFWQEQAAVGDAAMAAARRLDDDTARSRAHRILARAAIRLGRLDDADFHLRQVLDLSPLRGGERERAHIHLNLADLREQQRRFSAALDHSVRALGLYRAADFGIGEARALNAIGWYHALLGEYDRALACCEESLECCKALGFGYGQAGVWSSFGYIRQQLGQPDEALASFQRALDLYRDLDDRYEVADTLVLLGDLHRSSGDLDAARDAWQEALDILTDLEHPQAESIRVKLAGRGPE